MCGNAIQKEGSSSYQGCAVRTLVLGVGLRPIGTRYEIA
jgi:hypothetical protein